mgnify:CR=1 FL=1
MEINDRLKMHIDSAIKFHNKNSPNHQWAEMNIEGSDLSVLDLFPRACLRFTFSCCPLVVAIDFSKKSYLDLVANKEIRFSLKINNQEK